MTSSMVIALGAVNAAMAVGLGAFGAHGLRARLDARALEVFEIGVRYHLIHAVGLVVLGALMPRLAGLGLAAGLMLGGLALFSGSLYALALTGAKWFGPITPIGGAALIAAWVVLAVRAWQASP